MKKLLRFGVLAISAGALLSGCSETEITRGSLIEAAVLQAAQTKEQLKAAADKASITAIVGTPACSVSVYSYRFRTRGGANESTNSAAALMVPSGDATACQGERPVVLYGHGTTTDKAFNMANLENGEALTVAAAFAAQGFIVIAPNYAGYSGSDLAYHPYLNAEQQSGEMVDAWRAASSALSAIGAKTTSKLFLAGYSQGGFVSMATQRAMQLAGISVTSSSHMSPASSLSTFGDAVFGGNVNLGATVFLPLMTTSYQRAYGNIYTATSDIYETAYAAEIDGLLPSTKSQSTLFTEGKLPPLAMFSASSTPKPAGFEAFYGAGNLVKDSYRMSVLADIQANPTTPKNGLRAAALKNDLLKLDWTPTGTMLICGGSSDPTVFWEVNGKAAQTYFKSKGRLDSEAILLDVDSAATAGDSFKAIKDGFATAKAAVAATEGAAKVVEKYHGTLVPPFCMAAARSYFAAFAK